MAMFEDNYQQCLIAAQQQQQVDYDWKLRYLADSLAASPFPTKGSSEKPEKTINKKLLLLEEI